MLTIKRTFHAVGQGGLYSERITTNNKTITVVYDCGVQPSNKRIEREIKSLRGSEIDYLVLSHFHNDHINGVEELRKHTNIKSVVIPKLDPIEVCFYLLKGNTIKRLVLDPRSYFGSEINVIEVDNSDSVRDNDQGLISHITDLLIFSDQDNLEWVLRFYVDKTRLDISNLSQSDKNIIDSITTIKDFESKEDVLKKIYNSISKNKPNYTSMSMLSTYRSWNISNWQPPIVSLLNGDIELKEDKQMQRYIAHYRSYLCRNIDFQIPHHGSKNNLMRPLTEWVIDRAIVNCGRTNSHNHPSYMILRDHQDLGVRCDVITEYDLNVCGEYFNGINYQSSKEQRRKVKITQILKSK